MTGPRNLAMPVSNFAPAPSATTFATGSPAPPTPRISSVSPSITFRVRTLPVGSDETMHFTTPPFASASRKTANSVFAAMSDTSCSSRPKRVSGRSMP